MQLDGEKSYLYFAGFTHCYIFMFCFLKILLTILDDLKAMKSGERQARVWCILRPSQLEGSSRKPGGAFQI